MLKCYIVKDLLPNYVDGLLHEKTKQEIEEHLAGCADCHSVCKQLQTTIEADAPQSDKKEIDFLKTIKKKTKRVKLVAAGLAATLMMLGILACFFAIGTAVSSEDIRIETEIQYANYNGRVYPEWVIHLSLKNNKALVARSQIVFSKDAEGNEIATGCVITLGQAFPSRFLHESDNYTWGYSTEANEGKQTDFTVTVRLKDKDIVYSMKAEGLFEA